MNQKPIVNINVYSSFFEAYMSFPAFETENEPGQFVLTHNGLKAYMLNFMKERAAAGDPVDLDYIPVETGLSHSIVSCTIKLGGYKVIESGEASVATLNSTIAKSYPYLQAELRAFDRAVISFLQLNIDGRRVLTDEEVS